MTETKNYFTQRIPGFIDPRGMIRQDFEFNNTQEFLEHEYIQHWSKDDAIIMKYENNIIVKQSNGRHRLIGWVKNSDDLNLPIVEAND